MIAKISFVLFLGVLSALSTSAAIGPEPAVPVAPAPKADGAVDIVTAAEECAKITNCSVCQAKATVGGNCEWCTGKVGSTDLQIGYCVAPKTKCLDTNFGTLSSLAYFADKTFTSATPAKADCKAETSLLKYALDTCDKCDKDATFAWCLLDNKVGTQYRSSGGVCLNFADAGKAAAVCTALKAPFGVNTSDIKKGVCPHAVACTTKNCNGCLSARCMWCGLTVMDKTKAKGTSLGKCVDIKADYTKTCDGIAFNTVAKATDYNLGTHEYKSKVVPFTTDETKGGWQSGECNQNEVDVTPETNCKACVAKKEAWCKLMTTNDKKKILEGGVCLGKDWKVAKIICESFTQKAVKNEFFARTTYTNTNKCSGAVQNTVSLGLVMAGIAISIFVSS